MTLFESVLRETTRFMDLTEGAINQAIEKYGADKAVSFPIQHILYHATMQ